MAKISGLSQKFYLVQTGANGVGSDISGDVGSIDTCVLTQADINDTGIDKTYMERLSGLQDANLSYTGFFNIASGGGFAVAKPLVGTDGAAIWATSSAEGADAYCVEGLIDTFPVNRANNGSLTLKPKILVDAGVAGWGRIAMNATDTSGTTHANIDGGASSSFGCAIFAILLGFTGTSVTLALQDSADDSSFAALSPALSLTFTGSGTGFAYAATTTTATLRQYFHIVTSGTFSSAQVVAAVIRY